MRIAILGTGALGCVFAARLAAHAEVRVLGTWAEGIRAIARDGIRLTRPDGSRLAARVQTGMDPGAAPPVDLALLLVKSYQTERAAAWATKLLAPTGLVVTLQNGLDNLAKVAAAAGGERSAAGVTTIGATLIGPGEVRQVAEQPTFLGGGPAAAGRLGVLADLITRAGLEAHVVPDIESRIWGKAVANAAINPLTALWRVPNGELLATEDRAALAGLLAMEAAAVARARGMTLPFDDPVAHVRRVCRATAANRSSMLQDVERGRPTEIDSINGVIVAEAGRLGVAAPANEVIWRLVRGREG